MITVAVGGVLYHGGQVLMGKRSARRSYAGRWDIIGGHVEAGESLEQALIREFREEIDVRPTQFEHLAQFDDLHPDESPKYRYHVYVIRAWEGLPSNVSDEHDVLEWVSLSELAQRDLATREYVELFRDLHG